VVTHPIEKRKVGIVLGPNVVIGVLLGILLGSAVSMKTASVVRELAAGDVGATPI
tara:strand:- start:286 stop:450 length:165 start_codon:yes stop_codon:yes gene_type:complete